jgi:hypothetical protein
MARGFPTPELWPLEEDLTAEEKAAYEEQCLTELRRGEPLGPSQFIREAQLEGRSPSTVVYVRWSDTRYGREFERRYPIWGSSFECRGERTVGREVPQQVAMLIRTWIGEGG